MVDINLQLVLIGSQESCDDRIVEEIRLSHDSEIPIICIYMGDNSGLMSSKDGRVSHYLRMLCVKEGRRYEFLYDLYPTYDWTGDSAGLNLGTWLSSALERQNKLADRLRG